MTLFIADIKGFQYKQPVYLCEQLALIRCSDKTIWHRYANISASLFNKEPQNQMSVLTTKIQGLAFDESNKSISDIQLHIEQEEIKCLLNDRIKLGDMVLVKGSEKQEWFSRNLPHIEVIDAEQLRCPPYKYIKFVSEPSEICNHCNNYCKNLLNCCMENVHLLYYWVFKYFINFNPSLFKQICEEAKENGLDPSVIEQLRNTCKLTNLKCS